MHDPHPGTLRGRLLQTLASLPGITQPGRREYLLTGAGYEELAQQLDVHGGSTTTFFASLVNALAPHGPEALADLVTRLSEVAVVGEDRRQVLSELAEEIRGLAPADVVELMAAGTPIATLRSRARENTLKEIAEVGSKYLRDLYFRHDELEERVAEFLADDSVCLLIVSKPGRGKTSLLCALAERTVENSVVLLMSARVPVSEPHSLLNLIAGRLGYGSDWPGCFADLSQVNARGPRPLLLLDAINESPAKPEDMKAALHELLRQADSAGVKVVITCRTDFWQFYRTSFWSSYVRQRTLAPVGIRPSATSVEDVPLFPSDAFPRIAADYFAAFGIRGELRGEAAERCRHALVLRILCEAYRGQNVGVVEDFRLFKLFKLFWQRKVEQVADTTSLKGQGAVAELVLDVARLMRDNRSTTVPRNAVAARLRCTAAELDSSASLYSRVIDEEIILEESVDEELGVRNVVFIYDRFAEYVLALSLYVDNGWSAKSPDAIVSDALALMDDENGFPSLRGVLEFLVLRLEDLRPAELVHIAVVRAMVGRNWKWRNIATVLAFQLDSRHGRPFWDFLRELAGHEVDFVRRNVAEQSHRITADGAPEGLRILNDLLWDPNLAVQAAARQALLRLPSAAVPQEIQLLLAMEGQEAVTFAVQLLLLAPGLDDGQLRGRVEWLTTHGTDPRLSPTVTEVLETAVTIAYTELPWLARSRAAFDSASGPLADQYRATVAAKHEQRLAELEDDRLFLDRLYETLNDELRRAQTVVGEEHDPRSYLANWRYKITDGTTAPSRRRRADRLPAPALVAWEQLSGAAGLRCHLIRREVARFPYSPESRAIADLWQAMHQVATELQALPAPPDHREAWISFCRDMATKAGLDMTNEVASCVAHPQHLALWLWLSERERRRRRGGIGALAERLGGLPVSGLLEELEEYQHAVQLPQRPLADFLEALCRVLLEEPTRLAQVLAPLVVWHESRDTRMVDEALDELHWLDPDSFWFIVQCLLNHPDQRLITTATRAGERAEQVDESRSDDKREILDGLADIVNEIAGIPIEDIQMGASFTDDLNVDSLSLVEVVVASEERFAIRIPDEEVMHLRTVRDAVAYIARQRGVTRN